MLPNGDEVDSLGRPYQEDVNLDEEGLVIEKVSLALVDDLTVGDAVNMFSLHEAPYRPFLTYRARIALDGPLVHAPTGTAVTMPRGEQVDPPMGESRSRKNGRVLRGQPAKLKRNSPGPPTHNLKRDTE